MKLHYEEIETEVGPLLLIADDNDIALRIDFGTMADLDEKVNKWANRYFKNPIFVKSSHHTQKIKEELQSYFAHEQREFSFAYEFYGTTFQKQVWKALFSIPYGETRSYKDIAVFINNPKAVRAIGGAVNKNPMSIMTPCHRVIGANGDLIGYGGGLEKKTFLLKHEK